MVEAFAVVTTALDTDAGVWEGWGGKLEAAGEAVPTVGNGISAPDFSLLPGAQDVMNAYATASATFAQQLGLGARQFTGISAKLKASAARYEAAEQANLADIRSIEI